jgi:hypothetical protein
MPVIDKDRGWSALGKALQSLAGDPHVLVGIQGSQADAPHGDGLTVAEVASFNEFGTAHIPERSFIRATIDLHQVQLLQLAAALGTGVLQEKFAPGQALELLGEHARGQMIERINASVPPPNAPATIARKGSSTTLVDSGQTKNSLTYKVAV